MAETTHQTPERPGGSRHSHEVPIVHVYSTRTRPKWNDRARDRPRREKKQGGKRNNQSVSSIRGDDLSSRSLLHIGSRRGGRAIRLDSRLARPTRIESNLVRNRAGTPTPAGKEPPCEIEIVRSGRRIGEREGERAETGLAKLDVAATTLFRSLTV